MSSFIEFIKRVFTSSKFPSIQKENQREGHNVKTLENGSEDRKVILLDSRNFDND